MWVWLVLRVHFCLQVYNHILLVHNNGTIYTYCLVKMLICAFVFILTWNYKNVETFSIFRLKFTQGFHLNFNYKCINLFPAHNVWKLLTLTAKFTIYCIYKWWYSLIFILILPLVSMEHIILDGWCSWTVALVVSIGPACCWKWPVVVLTGQGWRLCKSWSQHLACSCIAALTAFP